MNRSDILALVMLPPPVHGASSINLRMIEVLRQSGESVTVLNTLPSGYARWFDGVVWKLLRSILVFFIFLRVVFRFFSPPKCVYISISGGLGLAFDCLLAFAIRLINRPVFVHHHSFSYINANSRLFRLFCFLVKPVPVTHVVLCKEMGDMLSYRYPNLVGSGCICVLSNAVFFSGDIGGGYKNPVDCKLRVGYIANITKEKGIYEVFDLAHGCHGAALPVEIVVAGPCGDSSIIAELNSMSKVCGFFNYIGPVYGSLKESFFESIDVLVFPTHYVNEAEPLVIYEAAERGVPTIANARGCIASMVSQCGGWAVKNEAMFVEEALIIISDLLAPDSRCEVKKRALIGSDLLRGASRGALDTLLTKIRIGSGSAA